MEGRREGCCMEHKPQVLEGRRPGLWAAGPRGRQASSGAGTSKPTPCPARWEKWILADCQGEAAQSTQRPVLCGGSWLCVEGLLRLWVGAARDPCGWFWAALARSSHIGLAGHRGQVAWLCSRDAQPASAQASAAGWCPHHTHPMQPIVPRACRAAAAHWVGFRSVSGL